MTIEDDFFLAAYAISVRLRFDHRLVRRLKKWVQREERWQYEVNPPWHGI